MQASASHPGTAIAADLYLPSLVTILDAAASAQVNRYNFETIELLRRTFAAWNLRTLHWDPPLRYHLVEISFLDVGDDAESRYLSGLPTSLNLPDSAVDRLREAARGALHESKEFQEFLSELNGASGTPAH